MKCVECGTREAQASHFPPICRPCEIYLMEMGDAEEEDHQAEQAEAYEWWRGQQ